MSLFLVNVLLVIAILVVMVLALLTLRRWYRKRARRLREAAAQNFLNALTADWEQIASYSRRVDAFIAELDQVRARRIMSALRLTTAALFLNVLTTIVGLVPLGFAVYNLIINNQQAAFRFNLVSLVTVVVSKGGLFLLTLILIPLLKAIPVGVGTGIGSIAAREAWKRVEARGKTKRNE
jgi:hypothetical protein